VIDALEEEEGFTYLGSIVDKQGGTDADVKTRIGKVMAAFLQLKDFCLFSIFLHIE
jgi:hypothetical protein